MDGIPLHMPWRINNALRTKAKRKERSMYIESNIGINGASPEHIKEITSNSIFFFDQYKNEEDDYYLHHGEENPWITIDIDYTDKTTTKETISSITELIEYCKRHNLVCDGWITIDPEQEDEYIEIDITNNVISIE